MSNRNSFSQNTSQLKNSSLRLQQSQSQREESKIGLNSKLSKNGLNSSSVKRINILEFKKSVEKELELQKSKLSTIQVKNVNARPNNEYFSNVYGPLTNKMSQLKNLSDLMQRNKAFDEAHFAIGCPCFHHGQKKKKKLFVDHSWFDGKKRDMDEREMMPINLDAMIADIYDDIPLDEGILVGELTIVPIKKKKGKMNMLRERFNEVLLDEPYPDLEKKYRIMGTISKPTKSKIKHFSFFEIEAGDIINFEFENKGVLTGKQMLNKIDFLEMSQFIIEISLVEQDNVLDVISNSRPQSAASSISMERSTQLSSSSGFCRKKQSHFSIFLMQKTRPLQFSYDAIETLKSLKADPAKLYRVLTTYDPVYQESLISLCIIVRDVPLMNYLFNDVFVDENIANKEGFFKFAAIEIFNGFQKVSFKFDKDRKFFLELQKRLLEQKNIQLSEFFFMDQDSKSYTPIYGGEDNKLSMVFRQRSKSYQTIAAQFSKNNNLSELEFSSKIFEKIMEESSKSIDNIDLFLEYYRDLYFNKFVLPDKFENNSYQCMFFGSTSIDGGRQSAKKNNQNVRYYNLLHNCIENRKNLDDIVRRFNETFTLFSQKDPCGNTPSQLIFKHANSEQIQDFIKQAGQDYFVDLRNDQEENILHTLYLNKNIAGSEEILGLLGPEVVNNLKNQKNKQGQYPLLYFLKRNLKRIKFPTLSLLIPSLEEGGDSISFIRNELLPIINASISNIEVMQFFMNRVGIFQIIYKYPPAIAKFYDIKLIYERLMQNLFDDNYYFMKGYQYLNLKQIQWFLEKDRSIIKKVLKINHPVYDWYVRKRQDSDAQIHDTSIITNKNQKLKKKQVLHNVIPLWLIKPKLRTPEVLRFAEPLPRQQTESQIPKMNELTWSNKVIYPNQDQEISKFFKSLFEKGEDGKYSSFKFEDYHAQKYFFSNLDNYEAKKHLLFEQLQKLDPNFVFHFKQYHNAKNQSFIKDLHEKGFLCLVEIKARPFVRFMVDQPSAKKEKWFQGKDDFKKIMVQKHCNHLTNIQFSIARDDNHGKAFQALLTRLESTIFMSESLLQLFYYYIIEGNAAENFRILSKYSFNLDTFLRWCRELKINPSTSMIQVILDEGLIPQIKLVQMIAFRRYNQKLMEQNILANLDPSQIQIQEIADSAYKSQANKQESTIGKGKLFVTQELFDLLCVKIKVKNFTKSQEWAAFILQSSLTNRSRMNKQNKRYIFSQNWPELWVKLRDPHTHSAVLYNELQKKLKEKVQFKNQINQPQNNKNNLQVEKKSIIISNKDYIKKCLEVLSTKMQSNIITRIVMTCVELGKPKWATKIYATEVGHQYKFFSLLRYYNIELANYKSLFQQSPFTNKDKQQSSQIENLKYLVNKSEEAYQILNRLERNESYSQIQQWIQRVGEEYRQDLALFFLLRYMKSLLNSYESSYAVPRKQIKKTEESLLPQKYRKKQEEYTQKLNLLLEKSSKKINKFKKEHSYNFLNFKDESNKEKIGNQKVNISPNKSMQSVFGSSTIFSTNIFQMEQLIETCIELFQSSEDSFSRVMPKKGDDSDLEMIKLETLQYWIYQYMIQKPDRIIGIIQKMKHFVDQFIQYIFTQRETRLNKKFNENIEYLSSKLIIKEYISIEQANYILGNCLKQLSHSNNNSIISTISKTYGKDVVFSKFKTLSRSQMKNVLPNFLIEYKNWLTKEDQKGGIQKPKIKQSAYVQKSEPEIQSQSVSLKPALIESNAVNRASDAYDQDSAPGQKRDGYDRVSSNQPAEQKPADQKQQNVVVKEKEEEIEYEIEYTECSEYHVVLAELASRESMRQRLLRQSKKQSSDGTKILDISPFQSELLNFDLASIITERDLMVELPSIKQGMIFAEFLLMKGLLLKNEQVDERLINAIQNKQESLKYIIQSQDSNYAKTLFDKLFSGKRSAVEQYMDENNSFYEMIMKGIKEDFIDKMISFYYRKSPDSLKLVELSIQNNMQKVFFSLIRSESDRHQIKQIIQNQYQYIKVFKHYEIINFAQTELELQQFNITEYSEDNEEGTFLLQTSTSNWLHMKLILAQEKDIESFNKTQKMFIHIKNLIFSNYSKYFSNKDSNLEVLQKLTELVFDRNRNTEFSSELSLIQSEVLKSQILHFPVDAKELEQEQQPVVTDKQSFYESIHSYTPVYRNKLTQLFKKPYQLIYWMKYRHGQQSLSFDSPDEEQFILKIRDIVNKYGPLQLDFNVQQKQLGVLNEAWLYNEHIRFLDINKYENYVFQLVNLLNPNNNIFPYFMFATAIYNSSLFIKLLPKLQQVLKPQQIEELLTLVVSGYLKKSVMKPENPQLSNRNKSVAAKTNAPQASPKINAVEVKASQPEKLQQASDARDGQSSQPDSILQALDEDQSDKNQIESSRPQLVQAQGMDARNSVVASGIAANDKQSVQPQLQGMSVGADNTEQKEVNPENTLFNYLKSVVQGQIQNENWNDQSDEEKGIEYDTVQLALQNALIILIKKFDATYYSKILCDNLEYKLTKEYRDEIEKESQNQSNNKSKKTSPKVQNAKLVEEEEVNDVNILSSLDEKPDDKRDGIVEQKKEEKPSENKVETHNEKLNKIYFDLKFISYILSQMDQGVQINSIKRLTTKININLKNCNDIGQFEQIVYFYLQHVEYLYKQPYNVKRIEMIYGNVNKYQYFSSQNMLLTLNYINIPEFEAFIQKEFEITKNIGFLPYGDLDIFFNLKVSSKSFGNNQIKTQRVITYLSNTFQQEIYQNDDLFLSWCYQYGQLVRSKDYNIDLFSQYYKDKPKVQSKQFTIELLDQIQAQFSQIKEKHKAQQSLGSEKELCDLINKFPLQIDIIAKEVQSSEYIKLMSPYERAKSMSTQLFLEKEVKMENTYFIYFYFDNNRLHIINTFFQTNIEPQKIIGQNKLLIPTRLDQFPTASGKEILEQFEESNPLIKFDFQINVESIKSEKNQSAAVLYCQRYLKQDLFIFWQRHVKTEKRLKAFIKSAYKTDQFELRFICFEANEEQTLIEMKKHEQSKDGASLEFVLGFDFSGSTINVSNSLILQFIESERIVRDIRVNTQTFLTQFNSIYDIYEHKIVIDFISYFTTIVMNCSQLKLMYTIIPNQLEKVISIIGDNAQRYGFKQILFNFTTTNQPFTLKSDCFRDPCDRVMRFGQTAYEVIKPFEDMDSSRFASTSSILKVTLSLAFKHPTKELTSSDRRDDDIESYFYKITNEFEMLKSVFTNREVLRKVFVQQKFQVKNSSKKSSEAKDQNIEDINDQNPETELSNIPSQDDKQQNNQQQVSKAIEDHNLIYNLAKLDSIIPTVFENTLKNQNDIQLYYKQVIEKIKSMEIYFLLYKDVDHENYREKVFDEKYSKKLISLMTTQGQLVPFKKLQREARNWVEKNKANFQKDFLNKLYQPIKQSNSSSSKNLTYMVKKDQTFQVQYPEQQVKLTLTQSKMIENKQKIKDLLANYTISYKGEEKWNISQWNAVYESCEGFFDATQITGVQCKEQIYNKIKKTNTMQNSKSKKLVQAIMSYKGNTQNISKEEKERTNFTQYFNQIQLTFTDGVSNANQPAEKGKKSRASDNIRVSFKNNDEHSTADERVLLIDVISTSESIRQDASLQILRAIVSEIKKGLPSQAYSPQQEHSRQKILRASFFGDAKENFFKFKKKVHEMNQNELIQCFFIITLSSYYQGLAQQVKKQIKVVLMTGLKKPVISENQNCYKIKLSVFQTVNAHQLLVQDVAKPIPKCKLYSINCITQLKQESVSDITNNANWEIQIQTENQNKLTQRNAEITSIQIDQNGFINFILNENQSSDPLIVKFIYKKEIITAYINKKPSPSQPQVKQQPQSQGLQAVNQQPQIAAQKPKIRQDNAASDGLTRVQQPTNQQSASGRPNLVAAN